MLNTSQKIQKMNLKKQIRYVICGILCLMVLAIIVPVSTYAAEIVRGTGTVTANDSLNVRSGPGKEYEAIGKVYKGNVLEVIGMENDWYKINYNNTEGYVSAEYMLYEPDEDLLVEDDAIDEIQEEASLEDDLNADEEEVSAGPEKYKIIFGLIAVIVVVLIIILVTIKSIKNLDLEDDEYYEDDDVDYDEDDDTDYEDDDYEDDDVDYDDEDDYEDEDDDESYEYKHIVIRKPKQSTIDKGSKKDDYLIDIDPRYFE